MIINIHYTLAVQAETVEPPSVEPKFTKPVSQTQGKVLCAYNIITILIKYCSIYLQVMTWAQRQSAKEVLKRTVMVQVVHAYYVCL